MFGKWLRLAALIVCAMVGAPSQAAPLEAYGKLPTFADVTLSPDGASIAYARDLDDKRVVVAQALATKQVLAVVNVTGTKLRNLQWADNRTLLMTTSYTGQPPGITHRTEFYMAQTYDVISKTQRVLLDPSSIPLSSVRVLNVVAGTPRSRIVDGHTIVFVEGVYISGYETRHGLFRIDLMANTTSMVSSLGDIHAEDWVLDDSGRIVAVSSYYEDEKRWSLDIIRDGNNVAALSLPATIESPSIEGLNEDATAVVVSIPGADGEPTYKQVALKDGAISPWVHAGPHFSGLAHLRDTDRVIGGAVVSEKNDFVFFDPRLTKMWLDIKATFDDATNVALVSTSKDHNTVVADVFGPKLGEVYYLIDLAHRKATVLGPTYAGIDKVAPQSWIAYRAADGREIHAYLTLPVGREAKNLPLIVLPHGGPQSRDYPGFDWISQGLASRGYAVLQPQFRGSGDWSVELLHAGFGEFGKKMQTDLSDGVRALAAQGVVDLKRVCIAGASYGGYAALAGATLDTGVYRCAVSIAGISDVGKLLHGLHWPRKSDARGVRFWDRFLATDDPDDPKLDTISPIKHIDKVTIPILLIHGKDDSVVQYAQSDDMADALKDAKKTYEFITLKAEDHWLSRSETRLQMLEATVKFLETNNPPN